MPVDHAGDEWDWARYTTEELGNIYALQNDLTAMYLELGEDAVITNEDLNQWRETRHLAAQQKLDEWNEGGTPSPSAGEGRTMDSVIKKSRQMGGAGWNFSPMDDMFAVRAKPTWNVPPPQ